MSLVKVGSKVSKNLKWSTDNMAMVSWYNLPFSDLADRVPCGFNGFAVRNAAAARFVCSFDQPGLELRVPGPCFNPVNSAVNGQQAVVKWFGAFALFGETWCVEASVGRGELALGQVEGEELGP